MEISDRKEIHLHLFILSKRFAKYGISRLWRLGRSICKGAENTWLDPVPDRSYNILKEDGTQVLPGDERKEKIPNESRLLKEYFKPMWRWSDALQNDFAARADWCVQSFEEANHPPVVKLKNALDISAKPGDKIQLSAKETSDPDGDKLTIQWWQYKEPDTIKKM